MNSHQTRYLHVIGVKLIHLFYLFIFLGTVEVSQNGCFYGHLGNCCRYLHRNKAVTSSFFAKTIMARAVHGYHDAFRSHIFGF